MSTGKQAFHVVLGTNLFETQHQSFPRTGKKESRTHSDYDLGRFHQVALPDPTSPIRSTDRHSGGVLVIGEEDRSGSRRGDQDLV